MTAPRVVAVVDSDSYLKWGAATLAALPSHWRTDLLVLRTPLLPSPAQTAAALAGVAGHAAPLGSQPHVTTLRTLRRDLADRNPDVVLASATGPVADLVLRAAGRLRRRPVLVSGLPGMSIPASAAAVTWRARADLLVVHSTREQEDFTALAAGLGVRVGVVRARLPFLSEGAGAAGRADGSAGGDDEIRRVVFAPQAKVPARVERRERVLLALAHLGRTRPDVEVVIKVRALSGEAQTHRERAPYDEIWHRLTAEGRVRGDEVAVAAGPMAEHLALPGTALVTVSSTAVLEAMASDVPCLVIGDFGLDDANLTTVFAGSGVVGSLEDLAAGRFFRPERAWLERNYFHDEHGALAEVIERTLAAEPAFSTVSPALSAAGPASSAAGPALSAAGPAISGVRRGRVRAVVRTGVPLPLLRVSGRVVRRVKRGTRAVRRLLRPVGPAAGPAGSPIPTTSA